MFTPRLGDVAAQLVPRLRFLVLFDSETSVKPAPELHWAEAPLYHCANPAIAVARSDRDLELIGRLRYELFIERDRKSYPEADHSHRYFVEPIDLESLNFMVIVAGGCIAACRVTSSETAMKDRYLSRIVENSNIKLEDIQRTVVCSRLSIARTLQAKRLSVALLKEGYRAIHLNGMRTILVASRPSLLRYYAKLGFHETGRRYFEGTAGELVIQQLRIHDRKNLEVCGSVFLEVHDQLQMNETLEIVT